MDGDGDGLITKQEVLRVYQVCAVYTQQLSMLSLVHLDRCLTQRAPSSNMSSQVAKC